MADKDLKKVPGANVVRNCMSDVGRRSGWKVVIR